MDFYDDEVEGFPKAWNKEREAIIERNRFLLRSAPTVLAGPAGGNVEAAVSLANALYNAIEAQAAQEMASIAYLKGRK